MFETYYDKIYQDGYRIDVRTKTHFTLIKGLRALSFTSMDAAIEHAITEIALRVFCERVSENYYSGNLKSIN